MLTPDELRQVINQILKSLDDKEFVEFLVKNEHYEEIENFCEGASFILIEYKSEKRGENVDKDNSTTE